MKRGRKRERERERMKYLTKEVRIAQNQNKPSESVIINNNQLMVTLFVGVIVCVEIDIASSKYQCIHICVFICLWVCL